MLNKEEYLNFIHELKQKDVQLIAVSKVHPVEKIQEFYDYGHRDFGENKVQELDAKHNELPEDIRWHLIGHLQRNKVKVIAPYISLIHSVDSLRLAREIDKRAAANERIIEILLQVHIADEEQKFGIMPDEVESLVQSKEFKELNNIRLRGLMGMATNTDNLEQIKSEFEGLKGIFDDLQVSISSDEFNVLSMGMSQDFELAIEAGANMIRVGSTVFGPRPYN